MGGGKESIMLQEVSEAKEEVEQRLLTIKLIYFRLIFSPFHAIQALFGGFPKKKKRGGGKKFEKAEIGT